MGRILAWNSDISLYDDRLMAGLNHTRTATAVPGLQLIIDVGYQGTTFLTGTTSSTYFHTLTHTLDADDSCRARPFVTFCQAL